MEFLSVAMSKYNVEIPPILYNAEDLEVKAFSDRSLKVLLRLCGPTKQGFINVEEPEGEVRVQALSKENPCNVKARRVGWS